MTTFAPHDPTLDERVADAWGAYRDRLVALGGRAYDEAEALAWDELQETLQEIDAERAGAGGDATTAR